MNQTPETSMPSGKNNTHSPNRLMTDFSADQEPSTALIEIDSFLPLIKRLSNALILPDNTYVR